jgi:hypothetical protein
LSVTQHWLCEDAIFSIRPDHKANFRTHRGSGFATLESLDHKPLTDDTSQEPSFKFVLVKSEASLTEESIYGNEEK